MRCILVNGATLKADARCHHCRKRIGASYVRELANRRIYCDRDCYCNAVGAPLVFLQYRASQTAEAKQGQDLITVAGSKWLGNSLLSGATSPAAPNRLRPSNWFVVS
jgi:hypothetical protein